MREAVRRTRRRNRHRPKPSTVRCADVFSATAIATRNDGGEEKGQEKDKKKGHSMFVAGTLASKSADMRTNGRFENPGQLTVLDEKLGEVY